MRLPAIAILLSALLLAACATGARTKQTGKRVAGAGPRLIASTTVSDPTTGALTPLEGPSFAKAAQELQAGQIDAAIGTFDALVKQNPNDLESQVEFARLLLTAGRLTEAKAVLDRVIARAPNDVAAQYALALLAGAQGDSARELKLLEALIAKDPKNAGANASLGEIYLGRNETAKAQSAFRASLAADPNNVTALLGDGEILLNVDRNATEALTRFNRAIQLQPTFSIGYSDRAEAEAALGDYPAAEQDYTKAISLDPTYYWHYIDRGKFRLMDENNTVGALADFTKAISLEPSYFLGYVYRAGLYEQLGDTNRAIADYRKLLELRPDYYFAYRPYAVLLYTKKDWQLSAEYFLKAAAADPADVGLQFLPAVIYLKQGKTSTATAYLTRLVAELPQSSMFYHLAQLYLDPAREPEFLSYLQSNPNPDSRARMQFYLACFYELHGRMNLAQQYFLDVQSHPVAGMYENKLTEAELANFR